MKYWPTDRNQQYVREDGEICGISKMLKEDLSPQIIYDEDIEMPHIVCRAMEEAVIGWPR